MFHRRDGLPAQREAAAVELIRMITEVALTEQGENVAAPGFNPQRPRQADLRAAQDEHLQELAGHSTSGDQPIATGPE